MGKKSIEYKAVKTKIAYHRKVVNMPRALARSYYLLDIDAMLKDIINELHTTLRSVRVAYNIDIPPSFYIRCEHRLNWIAEDTKDIKEKVHRAFFGDDTPNLEIDDDKHVMKEFETLPFGKPGDKANLYLPVIMQILEEAIKFMEHARTWNLVYETPNDARFIVCTLAAYTERYASIVQRELQKAKNSENSKKVSKIKGGAK